METAKSERRLASMCRRGVLARGEAAERRREANRSRRKCSAPAAEAMGFKRGVVQAGKSRYPVQLSMHRSTALPQSRLC